jgi:hypothetical protein
VLSTPDIAVQFDNESTSIDFPAEGVTSSAIVTELGERLFRLDSVPIFAESASFGDVIEADRVKAGTLRFLCVVRSGGWRTFFFLLSNEDRTSRRIASVLERVERGGGHWERVFGGCLFICLPPGTEWDPTADVLG